MKFIGMEKKYYNVILSHFLIFCRAFDFGGDLIEWRRLYSIETIGKLDKSFSSILSLMEVVQSHKMENQSDIYYLKCSNFGDSSFDHLDQSISITFYQNNVFFLCI